MIVRVYSHDPAYCVEVENCTEDDVHIVLSGEGAVTFDTSQNTPPELHLTLIGDLKFNDDKLNELLAGDFWKIDSDSGGCDEDTIVGKEGDRVFIQPKKFYNKNKY